MDSESDGATETSPESKSSSTNQGPRRIRPMRQLILGVVALAMSATVLLHIGLGGTVGETIRQKTELWLCAIGPFAAGCWLIHSWWRSR